MLTKLVCVVTEENLNLQKKIADENISFTLALNYFIDLFSFNFIGLQVSN